MKLNYKRFGNVKVQVIKQDDNYAKFRWSSDTLCDNISYRLNDGSQGSIILTPSFGGTFILEVDRTSAGSTLRYSIDFKYNGEIVKSISSSINIAFKFIIDTIDSPFSNTKVGDTVKANYTNTSGKNIFTEVRLGSDTGNIIYQETLTQEEGELNIHINPSILYPYLSDAQSCKVYYLFSYILDDGSTQLTNTTQSTISIRGDEYPVFRDTELVVSTTSHNALTRDYETVINGYSTLILQTFNAKSNYYAHITGYSATWGDVSTPIIEDTSVMPEIEITGGGGTTVTMTAYDTRGLSTQVKASATLGTTTNPFVPYTDPLINKLTVERDGGVGESVKLSAKGTFYAGKFGPRGVPNVITTPKYDVYDVETGKWLSETKDNIYIQGSSSWDYNSSEGTWEITDAAIHANGVSGGFNPEKKYIVKLIITDGAGLLGSAEMTKEVLSGKVARDVYKDYDGDYHEGINGLASDNYTENIHGTLNVSEGIYVNGELIGSTAIPGYSSDEIATGMTWIDGKPIYRKYIYLGNLPSTLTKTVSTGISGISSFVKMDGYITTGNGNALYCIPCTIGDTLITLAHNKTSNRIIIGVTDDMSAYVGYVIIEYTKNTD